MTQGSPIPTQGEDEEELNRAIDELRGVLRDSSDEEPARAGAMPSGLDNAAVDVGSTVAAPFGDDSDDGAEHAFSAGPSAFVGVGSAQGAPDSSLIMNIPVDVQIVLGSTEMQVSELMSLRKGATVALDRRIGEPVDVMVNGRRIARGEITVLDSDPSRFGIRLTEIITATKAP